MARSGCGMFSTPCRYFFASTDKSSQNNRVSCTH